MTTLVEKWHPAAEAYPMMAGDAYERLKESVKRNGVLKPIEVYFGTAFSEYVGVGIDGRNRAKVAAECGNPHPKCRPKARMPVVVVGPFHRPDDSCRFLWFDYIGINQSQPVQHFVLSRRSDLPADTRDGRRNAVAQ
jgi:hypothetical protein